jgi:hypothetical protein
MKDALYLRNVPTKSVLADLMTKAFPTPKFRHLCRMIGLKADSLQTAPDIRWPNVGIADIPLKYDFTV